MSRVEIIHSPRLRFALSLAWWMRIWLISIGAAMVLTLFGFYPTVISLFAQMGIFWMPIVVLVLWGRLLDEMIYGRDMEDGRRSVRRPGP